MHMLRGRANRMDITRRSLLALGLPALAACQSRSLGRLSAPDPFSINVPFDGQGVTDTRPGCWGTAGYRDFLALFTKVPAGQRIRLLGFEGDCFANIHGDAPRGTECSLLAGFITATVGPNTKDGVSYLGGIEESPLARSSPSPFVDPRTDAQSDCPLFVCDSVTANNSKTRIAIQRDYRRQHVLFDQNNCLLIRQAVFLNDTGFPVHMETTGIVEFEYVDV